MECFVSYAQNFEDVVLWRAFSDVSSGFYIDVGANDPTMHSVTKAFYDRGWSGINVEPVAQWFEKLERARPRDVNLHVAAGGENGEQRLYEIPDTGLSTFAETIAEKHESELGFGKTEIVVPVRTLTSICNEHAKVPIHFLKIDVEGAEKQVLDGLDLFTIRPRVILIEATLPLTQIQEFESWEHQLLEAGYEFAYFDGLNRFYVAREHRALIEKLRVPPNCFDDFSVEGGHWLCREITRNVEELRTDLANNELHQKKLQEERDDMLTRAKQAELGHSEVLARLEQCNRKLRLLRSELASAKSKLREQAQEMQSVLEELLETRESRARLSGIIDALRGEVEAIQRSKSWRVTLPLRFLMRLLRRTTSWARNKGAL